MTNLSAPVLDRTTVTRDGCGCFADAVPMPMGCAACGHAPYAHGCPGRPADHEYVQPSGALMRMRLQARRLGRPLPGFEPPADVAPSEVIPLVPAQRRPDLPVIAPAAPVVRPPLPKRAPRPVRRPRSGPPPRRPGVRTAGAPHPDGRRPAPCGMPPAVDGLRDTGTTPPAHRPPPPYGAFQSLLPHPIKRARRTLQASRRALNRTLEVRSVNNGRSTTPQSARPVSATSARPVIPGWQVFLSDRGRFWASRRKPFSTEAFHAGAERTVDADTFEELRAETARQEETATAQAVRS
ncbi:hypothetical protein [Streptosporangium sp. NPDC006007]|uniref:hypothetical protein n=1 Tax=Streptosporangium sp. NPDC006007 TaxID=3154575 RepID=UPI0033AAAAAB